MTNNVPQLTLNNGIQMPALGFGVFPSDPADTTSAVQTALEAGYRLIDAAAVYFNEREVGEGIRRSATDRSEVFIETKVWINDYGYDATRHAFEKSAGKLGVDTSSCSSCTWLSHDSSPRRASGRNLAGASGEPDRGSPLLPADRRTGGQHPARDRLPGMVADRGITFYPGWGENRVNTLEDPTISQIAQAHGKTPAQVMLRWHLDQGRSAIPKSVNPARIAENFDVLDFALTADEIAALDALDT